ncbi:hypothetical protein D3C71_2229680 [compost metagenome]
MARRWRWRRQRSKRQQVLYGCGGGEIGAEALQFRSTKIQDVNLAILELDASERRLTKAALRYQFAVV